MVKKRHKLSAAAERHVDRLIEAHYNPAFEGTYEFDVTIEAIGKKVTRRAKAVYKHTPEWRHWDPRKGGLTPGVGSTRYRIEVLAVPEDFRDDGTWTAGTPAWIDAKDFVQDGVLTVEMRDEILQGIDEQCRAEDAERRRAAAGS